ncbi:MAG: 4a-hydroxytetrahydrobiopterin dehydratase [Mycetocola sp.]
MTSRATLTPDDTRAALSGSAFRHVGDRLEADFRTGDFATGARFVAAIAEDADELGHHPDLTLSYGTVGARLSSHDAGGVTTRDLDLARRIDDAARAMGIAATDT